MTQLDKIQYMIDSLYLAKNEIEYAQAYYLRKRTDKSFNYDFYDGFGAEHRIPNGTIIRESLRMVGRIANQLANECVLTPYCDEIFKENRGWGNGGDMMEWNVYYHDFNANEIVTRNIFKHAMFTKDVNELLRNKNLNKEEFSERLRKDLMYYFWARSEYEVIIKPWVGEGDDIKIDIYGQVLLNWNRFVDYVWSFRK